MWKESVPVDKRLDSQRLIILFSLLYTVPAARAYHDPLAWRKDYLFPARPDAQLALLDFEVLCLPQVDMTEGSR
jgi:hypothetical protein